MICWMKKMLSARLGDLNPYIVEINRFRRTYYKKEKKIPVKI